MFHFEEATKLYDLETLYKSIEKADQLGYLTGKQKEKLRALLLCMKPIAIAKVLGANPSTVTVALSLLYRRIEAAANKEPRTVNYKNAKQILLDAGVLRLLNDGGNAFINEVNHQVLTEKRDSVLDSNVEGIDSLTKTKPDKKILSERVEDIKRIEGLIENGSRAIVITGSFGMGKTYVAQEFLGQGEYAPILVLVLSPEQTAEETIVEFLNKIDSSISPRVNFDENLELLRESIKNKKVGILIDNIDIILNSDGQIKEKDRSYKNLLRILNLRFNKSITLITSSRSLPKELDIDAEVNLDKLKSDRWKKLFQENNIKIENKILNQLCDKFLGMPLLMTLSAHAIKEFYEGDMVKFWADYPKDILSDNSEGEIVKNFIEFIFDQLGNLNFYAYNLLCKISVYRFDKVGGVTKEGLFALVPNTIDTTKMNSLQLLKNLSLLIENDKDKTYSLRQSICGAALEKLKSNKQESDETHRKAARFWAESIKEIGGVKDLDAALEAIYHYLEIGDYNSVCNELAEPRQNTWIDKKKMLIDLPLGNSLMLLGTNHQKDKIRESLNEYKDKEEIEKSRYAIGMAFNTVGDMHLNRGDIDKALIYYEQAEKIADHCLSKFLQLATKINQAGCLTLLEEYDRAESILKQIIKDNTHKIYNEYEGRFIPIAESIYSYLLAMNAIDKVKDDALKRANKVMSEIEEKVLGLQGSSYRLLFLGHTYLTLRSLESENVKVAQKAFEDLIWLALKNKYRLIEGMGYVGLGKTYRVKFELDKDNSILKDAHAFLDKAIDLFKAVGAKFYLGDAYYQKAVAYKLEKNEEKEEEFNLKSEEATKAVKTKFLESLPNNLISSEPLLSK